jgi:hypothetical protein
MRDDTGQPTFSLRERYTTMIGLTRSGHSCTATRDHRYKHETEGPGLSKLIGFLAVKDERLQPAANIAHLRLVPTIGTTGGDLI